MSSADPWIIKALRADSRKAAGNVNSLPEGLAGKCEARTTSSTARHVSDMFSYGAHGASTQLSNFQGRLHLALKGIPPPAATRECVATGGVVSVDTVPGSQRGAGGGAAGRARAMAVTGGVRPLRSDEPTAAQRRYRPFHAIRSDHWAHRLLTFAR